MSMSTEGVRHHRVEANGIGLHVAEQGSGPMVLLCHGFPESWYSWRHQLSALAAAGFRAVAPDMRGYGQSDRPDAIDQYTLFHMAGDMIGLLDALGVKEAIIVGHDWGAPVAWQCALMRPDRFRGVVGMSVPFIPQGDVRPSSVWPVVGEFEFYMRHFQKPGLAEAEMERDVRRAVGGLLWLISGERPAKGEAIQGAPAEMMVHRAGGFDAALPGAIGRPAWLTEDDLRVYVEEFERTGFRGGLNWYRNIDRNWELSRAYRGAKITVPALFVAGDQDVVPQYPGVDSIISALPKSVPLLKDIVSLSGCGHWTQQERPQEVNDALIAFICSLDT
jgi:pimeloyl-ACP methyl ester carboxylesterase